MVSWHGGGGKNLGPRFSTVYREVSFEILSWISHFCLRVRSLLSFKGAYFGEIQTFLDLQN